MSTDDTKSWLERFNLTLDIVLKAALGVAVITAIFLLLFASDAMLDRTLGKVAARLAKSGVKSIEAFGVHVAVGEVKEAQRSATEIQGAAEQIEALARKSTNPEVAQALNDVHGVLSQMSGAIAKQAGEATRSAQPVAVAAPAPAATTATAVEPALAEGWIFLGRRNDEHKWAPASSAVRLEGYPKSLVVVAETGFSDRLDDDAAGAGTAADAAAARPVRMVLPGTVMLDGAEERSEKSAVGGELVYVKAKVPARSLRWLNR